MCNDTIFWIFIKQNPGLKMNALLNEYFEIE